MMRRILALHSKWQFDSARAVVAVSVLISLLGCGKLATAISSSSISATIYSATWISGSTTVGTIYSTYGTQGVPSSTNTPGQRKMARTWFDAAGNLWLFGGATVMSGNWYWYNDLWKFTVSTQQWTWISGQYTPFGAATYGTLGVANAANLPGARFNYSQWTDSAGNFWIFGGSNGLPSYLNDLWKYNPTTNQWTWMSGSNTANQNGTYGTLGVGSTLNVPSARGDYGPSSSWVDGSGNFWLVDGTGMDSLGTQGALSDVWKYNPTSNQWTWMNGSKTADTPPVFGTQGVASASNTPGGRGGSGSWIDASGNLWIYGGMGYDHGYRGGSGYFNLSDLWMYNPTANQWTYISGNKTTAAQTPNYGIQGVSVSTNSPGSYSGGITWSDSNHNFWLLGTGDTAIWNYSIATGQWTWVAGKMSNYQGGNYGILKTPSAHNFPGQRSGESAAVDQSNKLWIFGGTGYDSVDANGDMNDLWKVVP